jgi:hypothetical protein
MVLSGENADHLGMKPRFSPIALAIALAGAGASLAFAADGGHGKGKPKPSSNAAADCQRFDFRGTLSSIGGSGSSFSLKRDKNAGTVTVGVTSTTQVFWTGTGSLSGPKAGERVWVKGTQCGTPPDVFTASWVLVSDARRLVK